MASAVRRLALPDPVTLGRSDSCRVPQVPHLHSGDPSSTTSWLMWQRDGCVLLAVPILPSTGYGTFFLTSVECVNVQILSSVATACRQFRRPCFMHYESNSCFRLKPTVWASWPTSAGLASLFYIFSKKIPFPLSRGVFAPVWLDSTCSCTVLCKHPLHQALTFKTFLHSGAGGWEWGKWGSVN